MNNPRPIMDCCCSGDEMIGRKRKRQARNKRNNDHCEDNNSAVTESLGGGDILWLILQRLPLQTLFQCKCVCKSWNTMIADPVFPREYLHAHRGNKPPSVAKVFTQRSRDHRKSREHRKGGRNHKKTVCSIVGFEFTEEQQPGVVHQKDVLDAICHRNTCFPVNDQLKASKCGILLFFDRCNGLVYNPLTGATNKLPPAPTSKLWATVVFICR